MHTLLIPYFLYPSYALHLIHTPEGKPNSDEQERIKTAMHEGGSIRDHKFFLCSEMEETFFEKRTKGGMQRHRYFDLGAEVLGGDENVPSSLAELAEELRKIPWPF